MEQNSPEAFEQLTSLALTMSTPFHAIYTLTALTGISISVASAIMAFVDPEVHAVIYRHSIRALGGKNLYLGTWTAHDYEMYRQYLLANKETLTLREL